MQDESKDLQVGIVTIHPVHGECKVTFVGEDRVGVEFENGRHALLPKSSFSPDDEETRLELARIAEASKPRPATWPENTFVPEPSNTKHFMGSHWDPFEEDRTAVLKRLPEMLAKAQLQKGYGQFYAAVRAVPTDWPRGAHLIWPGPEHGVTVTLRSEKTANMVTSIYPCIGGASEVSVRIDRVLVWEGGVEAQIDAEWNGVPVTFFDTHFLINRAWYEAGESYNFILAGLAYAAKPSEIMELPFTPNPEQVAWERVLAELNGTPAPAEPKSLSLKGMAILMPVSDWDADDYSFRGPVKSVKPADQVLGQEAWRVRITVMRCDDQDMDLDVFITHRVWQGKLPPQVGDDVEGHLWLQGRLWSVERGQGNQ